MRKILLTFLLSLSLKAEQQYTIFVKGMHCPLCTAIVRKAILQVNGVTSVKVSLKDKSAFVKCEDKVLKEDLLKAVATTGYTGVFVE